MSEIVDLGVRKLSGSEIFFHEFRINPLDFKCSILIAQLADGWLMYSHFNQSSESTTRRGFTAIRSVGRFLDDDKDRLLNLCGNDRTVHRLHDWEVSLKDQFSPNSRSPHSLGSKIRQFTRLYLKDRGIANTLSSKWAESEELHPERSSESLDDFNPRERREIRDSCQNLVRVAERNSRNCARLLALGRNPITHGWDDAANAIWGLLNLPKSEIVDAKPRILTSSRYGRLKLEERLGEQSHWSFSGHYPIQGMLSPNQIHLTAIVVLILLKTGWSPEEIKWLTVADIEFSPEEVRIRRVKRRANRVRFSVLKIKGRAGNYGWSAGDLFCRARDLMCHIKGENTSPYFWQFFPQNGAPLPERVDITQTSTCSFKQGGAFTTLIERCGIEISQPHDLRRVRKTVKSVRGGVAGTLAGAAGDDHSTETFGRYYAGTTTLRILAAEATTNAQTMAFETATGPILIPEDSNYVANSASGELQQVAKDTIADSSERLPPSVATCRDPEDAPHLPTGDLCLDAPAKCLDCANARIFRDHLPRLLSYRSVIEKIAVEVSSTARSEIFRVQLANIDKALSTFTEEQILAAQQSRTTLHIPLTMKGQHF